MWLPKYTLYLFNAYSVVIKEDLVIKQAIKQGL